MEEEPDTRAVPGIDGLDAAGLDLHVVQLPEKQEAQDREQIGKDVGNRDVRHAESTSIRRVHV